LFLFRRDVFFLSAHERQDFVALEMTHFEVADGAMMKICTHTSHLAEEANDRILRDPCDTNGAADTVALAEAPNNHGPFGLV